jgi:hypothetical protein
MNKMTKLFFSSVSILALAAACEGEQGPAGENGAAGAQGPTGQNGADGADGTNGADGMNGTNGADGIDAARYDFRTETPDMYTRVDRMGMPAVATALIGSSMKEAYNDADPNDDITDVGGLPMWAGEYLTNLTNLHMALEDDLGGAGLTRCSSGTGASIDVSNCAFQELAPSFPVVALIVPDTLTLDTSAAAGFPNGRRLEDPVIDVTLAVLLLDLTAQTPADLVGVLNPAGNDVETLSEFPYLGYPF